MDHFDYKSGILHADNHNIKNLAEKLGTPFYCYSLATVERHYRVFNDNFNSMDRMVCYAAKANSNHEILQKLASLGSGADVVSGGEITRAIAAGIPAERIVFSGVGKTRVEIKQALELGIFQFNIESEPELLAINEIASSMNVKVPIAIRINPDVDPKTHAKISTGLKQNKFGIEMETALQLYDKASRMSGIKIQGVSVHIGSQLMNLQPFRLAFTVLRGFVEELRQRGHAIATLDLGGGFGISYGDDEPPILSDYAAIVRETVGDMGCKLLFEPGRMIVGNAGVLVTKVLYVKKTSSRTFVIVDAGMNDLMRPALYGARHKIIPVSEPASGNALAAVDIVGPVCESSDIFAEQEPMPPLNEGDLLAIRSAGAYGAAMANQYNSRPLVKEIAV